MPSTAYFFNLRDGYPFAESCVGKCIACGDETSTQDSGVCYRCPSGKHYVHSGCITATFLDSSDSRRHVGEGDAYDMTFPCRECAREGQKSGHEFCVVPAHTTYELVGQTEYGPVYVTEVDDEFDASAVSTIRLKDRFRYRATAKGVDPKILFAFDGCILVNTRSANMLEPWRKRVRSDLGLDKRAKRPFDPPRVRVPSTPRFSDGAPRAETPATLAGANVLQTLSQDVGTLSTESPELSLRMRPVDFEGDFAPFLEVRQLKRVCGVMEEEIGDVQEDFVRLRTDALALYRFLLKKGFKEQASVVSTFHTAFQDIEQRHASLKRRVESFGPPDSEISDEEGRALFAECVTPGCITA